MTMMVVRALVAAREGKSVAKETWENACAVAMATAALAALSVASSNLISIDGGQRRPLIWII
jgi:hypothetical protein